MFWSRSVRLLRRSEGFRVSVRICVMKARCGGSLRDMCPYSYGGSSENGATRPVSVYDILCDHGGSCVQRTPPQKGK